MGQFTTMDPLAEKYYSTSPYAYCANDPVNKIDPDGRDWYLYYNESENENKYVWSPDPTNQKQLDNVFGKDKTQYLGITYTEGDSYYGLTGGIYDSSIKEGKVMQKIDDALIKYYQVSSNNGEGSSNINFDIGEYPVKSALNTTQNTFFSFYSQDQSQITYYKVAKGVPNIASFSGWGKIVEDGYYKVEGNSAWGTTGNIDTGVTFKFERKSASSITPNAVIMVFKDRKVASKYSDTVSGLLKNRLIK